MTYTSLFGGIPGGAAKQNRRYTAVGSLDDRPLFDADGVGVTATRRP
jgi:hypothetical protein